MHQGIFRSDNTNRVMCKMPDEAGSATSLILQLDTVHLWSSPSVARGVLVGVQGLASLLAVGSPYDTT